jgi:hypothetical protein
LGGGGCVALLSAFLVGWVGHLGAPSSMEIVQVG